MLGLAATGTTLLAGCLGDDDEETDDQPGDTTDDTDDPAVDTDPTGDDDDTTADDDQTTDDDDDTTADDDQTTDDDDDQEDDYQAATCDTDTAQALVDDWQALFWDLDEATTNLEDLIHPDSPFEEAARGRIDNADDVDDLEYMVTYETVTHVDTAPDVEELADILSDIGATDLFEELVTLGMIELPDEGEEPTGDEAESLALAQVEATIETPEETRDETVGMLFADDAGECRAMADLVYLDLI